MTCPASTQVRPPRSNTAMSWPPWRDRGRAAIAGRRGGRARVVRAASSGGPDRSCRRCGGPCARRRRCAVLRPSSVSLARAGLVPAELGTPVGELDAVRRRRAARGPAARAPARGGRPARSAAWITVGAVAREARSGARRRRRPRSPATRDGAADGRLRRAAAAPGERSGRRGGAVAQRPRHAALALDQRSAVGDARQASARPARGGGRAACRRRGRRAARGHAGRRGARVSCAPPAPSRPAPGRGTGGS